MLYEGPDLHPSRIRLLAPSDPRSVKLTFKDVLRLALRFWLFLPIHTPAILARIPEHPPLKARSHRITKRSKIPPAGEQFIT